MFTIGMRVTLEMDQNGEKEQYTSKVIEFDRNYLYLTYPSHQRKGTTTYVEDGKPADLSVIGSNNVVYKFSSEILGRKRSRKFLSSIFVYLIQQKSKKFNVDSTFVWKVHWMLQYTL